jgi:hypothetical protein
VTRISTLVLVTLLTVFALAACVPIASPARVDGAIIMFTVPPDLVDQAWAVDIVGPPNTALLASSPEPTRCDPGSGVVVQQCLWTSLETGQIVTLQLSGEPPSFGCAFWRVIGGDRYPCLLPLEAPNG